MASQFPVIAAFDIGTTSCCYAVSLAEGASNVHTNPAWMKTSGQPSYRTPTCVLVNPSGEFDSVGYKAEDKYIALANQGQDDGWRFFRYFKLVLYTNEHFSRETVVNDIQGRPMPAVLVLAMTLRYLQQHAVRLITHHRPDIREKDIQYVITIPPEWNDSAKGLMREAAFEAGIDSKRLLLLPEPEAAAIWCQLGAKFPVNTLFLVADLAGGTGDITVLKKLVGGRLSRVYGTSNPDWGGINVDEQFLELLRSLFGRQTIAQFKKKHVGDFLALTLDFEARKQLIPFRDTRVVLRLPRSLLSLVKSLGGNGLQQKLSSLGYGNKVILSGTDKLTIHGSIISGWFDQPIRKFVGHIQHLLENPNYKDISRILLIGGFGGNQLVLSLMRKELKHRSIITPLDSTLTIVQGAVVFGQDTRVISRRILKYTYGIDGYVDFDRANHPPEYLVIRHGKAYLRNAFIVFAKAGQHVDLYQEVTTERLPTDVNYTNIRVFRCRRPNPTLVTDQDCEQIGSLSVEHSERCSLDAKRIAVTFMFGGTELTVKARLTMTGEESFTTVDLM